MPPLRDRQQDIPELGLAILSKIARENDAPVCELSNGALAALHNYSFPGNVREFENILQRAATLCEEDIILESDLEFILETSASLISNETQAEVAPAVTANSNVELDADFSLEKHLESIEIKAIEKALAETRWNKTAAAKKLGMSFRSLRYRLKKLGLD